MQRKLASVISYPCHELRWNTGLNNYVSDTEVDILTNSAVFNTFGIYFVHDLTESSFL